MPRYQPKKIIHTYQIMIAQQQADGKINFSAIARRMKLAACTVNRWYREADEGKAKNRYGKMWNKAKRELGLPPKAKKGAKKVKPKHETAKPNEQLLREENRYLRWVNEGYRLGWVDRLMGEYLKGG